MSLAYQREEARLQAPSRFSSIKKGNIMADGTEQTILEFEDVGKVMGYIDLSNMETGDTVVMKQYMKILNGDYKRYAREIYTGLQEDPILYIKCKETELGIKVTLQQTAGVFRSFDYNFIRET